MEQTTEGPCTRDATQLAASVWLRLVRGASDQPLYMVSGPRGEEGVSVGSADGCDWRVEGVDVPPHALQLRMLASQLFARAIGEADVLVDGEQLAAMWVPIAKGARIEVGTLAIEVGLSGRSRAAQSQRLLASMGAEAALDEAADSLLARFSVTGLESPDLTSALCDGTCAATVLDPEAQERSVQPWRSTGLLIAGSLMACAYGCWVLLLDHL